MRCSLWCVLACLAGTSAVRADEPLPRALTVITHGYQGNRTVPAWLQDMADAIADRDCGALDHEVLLFDWAELSTTPGAANSDEVAGVLADEIMARLSDESPLHLHLIGHSRGAFVMLDVAKRLGRDAVARSRLASVHLTTLDPVNFDRTTDPDITLETGGFIELILFRGFRVLLLPDVVTRADNYHQSVDSGFTGHTLLGAFNVSLNLELYRWKARSLNHLEVHDWYHWTIDKTDGDDDYADVPGTAGLRSWLYRQRSQIDFDGDTVRDGWGYDISEAAVACAAAD